VAVDTNKKAISSDEAVKRLEKIKRAFDDSFNEIVKSIEKKGKKPRNSTANVKTQLSAP